MTFHRGVITVCICFIALANVQCGRDGARARSARQHKLVEERLERLAGVGRVTGGRDDGTQ